MKLGWVAMIALLLLVAVKVGLMQMRASATGPDGETILFQAQSSAAKASAPPIWKPILL